ncbi:MAG: peptidoglycan-binding protein [Bacteroidetes bacterium]|nr:peptidoglycan-binding protein [Bacteroidota bacterium]
MAIQLNDKGPLVKKWQQFLKDQGFFTGEVTDFFGQKTLASTKAFQSYYAIPSTGFVGSLTLGKASQLGFNPDREPAPPRIRNDADMMRWIHDNLGNVIRQAITGTSFAEDLLAGMCARETGYKIIQFFNQGHDFAYICENMKGDYGRRSGETAATYHGFGFWQVDVQWHPAFVNSGDWKDPLKCARKAASVLNDQVTYLTAKGWHAQLSAEQFERAVTAAYNCGGSRVDSALRNGRDVDYYTFTRDYSKEVWRYRAIYRNL